MKSQLTERIRNLKALVLDCDGVMTDAKIYYLGEDRWTRSFSIRDGLGIKRLQLAGIKVAVITGSDSDDIRSRMKSLKIEHFYEGSLNKLPAWNDFLAKSGLSAEQVAYMGDDEVDLPLMKLAAVSFTVPDGVPSAIACADYVAEASAGVGAVREVCELILSLQNLNPEVK